MFLDFFEKREMKRRAQASKLIQEAENLKLPRRPLDTKGAHLERWPGSQGAETPTNPILPAITKL